MPKGHRPSTLPIAQFCSLAPELAKKHGAGRSALVSSAFHARAAEEDGWEDRWARLTDEEQREVNAWKTPTDIVFTEQAITLRYEDAQREVKLGLGPSGESLPYDSDDAVTGGTADLLWVVSHGGVTTVYLADIKRGWFTQDDPLNLQNLAYGFAAAAMYEADYLACGLWYAEDGGWKWSHTIDMMGDEAVVLMRRVIAAALNDGGPCVGGHCNGCYQRGHCPEWMLPPDTVSKMAGDFMELAGTGALTQDKALELRRLYERGAEFLKRLDEALRTYAASQGGIVDEESGKVWGPSESKGRVRLNKKLLDERYPGAHQECSTRGKPVTRFEWRKM